MLSPSTWLLLLTCLAPRPRDSRPEPLALDSVLTSVTVYPGSAVVTRRADLEGHEGRFVLAGLPVGLDPDSVRVRLAGGEVVGVEVRDRLQKDVPDERLAELRERIRGVERELVALDDEAEVQQTLLDHVQRLLRQEEGLHRDEVAGARPDPEAWETNFRYLAGKLKELKDALRELEPRRAERRLVLEDLRGSLGRFESSRGVRQKDLLLDVVGPGTTLEVEYLVGNAGWEPSYDLRARQDLTGVELAYRARVRQLTGEDWREAEIVLSTARPQRGAQGPEPRPIWLALDDPRVASRSAPETVRDLGYGGDDAPASAPEEAASPFAGVEREGLAVRFRLPRKETIESRPEPSTVLVGRTTLAFECERFCLPALDPTVWLRGRTRNTSEWVLLPGRAAVYLGADFVGHASLDSVQPGQAFDLALGADPSLTVERTLLEDLHEGSGVFSSRATQREAWRIEIENHGALALPGEDGVAVIVQEVLPRPRDERIKVSLDEARPRPSEDARWTREREESGVVTWVLRVPSGASRTIELATEVTYPERQQLVRR